MKMKPAERNSIKRRADEAKREIARLEGSLAKFKVGTLPYDRLKTQLDAARNKLESANRDLARTTLPN